MQKKINDQVEEDFVIRMGDLIYTTQGILIRGDRTNQNLEATLKTLLRLETKIDILSCALNKALEEKVEYDKRRKRRRKFRFITRKDNKL